MNRIAACLARLKQDNRKALIPFITAGDPQKQLTVNLMHRLAENGADIIELGVPFSDPMADGPVIQLADERALANGVTTQDVLTMVAEFRASNQHTPVVLMGYLNPIEVYGYEAFATAATAAGVDGMIIVDLPPEAATGLQACFEQAGLDTIYLIAPTTSESRIGLISAAASGYLYYVSLKGVTGSGHLDLDSVANKLETIRKQTDLPIVVGFGIKDAATAKKIGRLADGVVVGSALVSLIAERADNPDEMLAEVSEFTRTLRNGIDQ